MSEKNPSAATLVIGNEILSGRTLDMNTQIIAQKLSDIGIDLIETRTIRDDAEAIRYAVNELRKKYSYLFTTGGVGPTHDDITIENIAAAFGRACVPNQKLRSNLQDYCTKHEKKWNSSCDKMIMLPKGASLLVEYAPGFILENVIVMAGVPKIMSRMLDAAIPHLVHGQVTYSKALDVSVGETVFAEELTQLQQKYGDVEIGSYPFTKDDMPAASLILRSKNQSSLEKAFAEIMKLNLE